MSRITDIQYNKKGDKAKVYLDGELYGNMAAEVIMRHRLNEGEEVDYEQFDRICRDSELSLAFEYLIGYISKYTVTRRKMYAKLKEKGYSAEIIDITLDKGEEYGYINDRAYAEQYIYSKIKNSGKYKIKSELSALGIGSDISDEIFNEIDSDDIISYAIAVAENWSRGKDLGDRAVKEKLSRYMSSKGYSWDIISKCIDKVCEEDYDE